MAAAGATANTPLRRPHRSVGPVEWARGNLFSSPFNAALTVLGLALLAWALPPLFRWLVTDAVWSGTDRSACAAPGTGACWAFIKAKFGQFVYGRYPLDQRWRVDLTGALFVAGIVPVAIPSVPFKRANILYLLVLFPVLAFALLYGAPGLGLTIVETALWGGLLVTLVVALTGMAVSLPLAVILALGRRSSSPLIRIPATAFIELVRGVPLITVLYMASLMLPLFIPNGQAIDKLLRALVGVALFAGANIAEVVRGGLQAVPRGQLEGALSLGLTRWQATRLVVLPQALRTVIPGIVNSYIALFKDTSLVLIIGLFDLLGTVQLNFADAEWATASTPATGYVFAAAVYWVFCFGLSRYSQAMERRLGASRRTEAR
ncbi:MAG: amino acid ABC transporter permease [Bauldia sp.]